MDGQGTITLTTGASLKLENGEINWKTLPKLAAFATNRIGSSFIGVPERFVQQNFRSSGATSPYQLGARGAPVKDHLFQTSNGSPQGLATVLAKYFLPRRRQ